MLVLADVPNLAVLANRPSSLIRLLKPFLRPFVPFLAAFLSVSIFAQIFSVAEPLFSRVIVDDVLPSGDMSMLHVLLLGMLLVSMFQICAGVIREFLVAHIMRRLSGLMQLRFFHHILSLTQQNAARWSTGGFLLRFQENEKLLQLMSQSGVKIIVDGALALFFIGLLIALSAKLAIAAIPFIFAMLILLAVLSPVMRNAQRRVFAARQATESFVIQTVSGIQTLKSLAIEGSMYETGAAMFSGMKLREFELAKLTFTSDLIARFLNNGATIAILGVGAQLALTEKLTTGQLVAFLGLFASTITPLRNLVGIWDEMQEIRVSFQRTAEVLSAGTETESHDSVAPLLTGRVEFRNVSFQYGADTDNVISDFSLDVLPGQKIALVGRSGSGKTTLASLLLNLYQPTEGTILVDGVDLNRMQKAVLRRQIGIVEQSPFLFSGSVRDNIAKADPEASLDYVVAAATLAGAHAFIEQLPMGYDTRVGERGLSLSGGQRQRLVIARALLNSPRILILDEATSALDSESENLIQRNLDAVMKGRTTFVIAHRLSTVRNADLIVVLDKGRIVECGTHQDLMERRGLYSYLNAQAAQ
jgi:ATP-binding cassette subfamily B protein